MPKQNVQVVNVQEDCGGQRMFKEFKMLIDVYGPPDADGNSRIIKKNVIRKKLINLHDIEGVEELTNDLGRVLTTMCIVEYKGRSVVLKHRYNEMYMLIKKVESASKPIGFIYGKKKK